MARSLKTSCIYATAKISCVYVMAILAFCKYHVKIWRDPFTPKQQIFETQNMTFSLKVVLSAYLLTVLFVHRAIGGEAPTSSRPIKIACVGDSITFGAFLENREKNCYPAKLQATLGQGYEVHNFGVNCRALQQASDSPYWLDKAFKDAQALNPDWVLIKLGTNDTSPRNWTPQQRFAEDAKALVDVFKGLPSKPRITICLPVPLFKDGQNILKNEILPSLRQTSYEKETDLIDLHTPFLDQNQYFPDTIHPNAAGANLLAQRIARHLSQLVDLKFDLATKLPKETRKSNFHGYACYDFKLEGHDSKIVLPKRANARHDWAWRMEFFGHEPQTDLALLENGFHLVFINTFGLNGSPLAVPAWEKMYDFATRAGLAPKATLIGFSRGGLYSYNWAVAHPDRVQCIYADAPVLDIRSWPGGKGKGAGSPSDWQTCLSQYGLTESTAGQWKGPLDQLDRLAQLRIPLIHVVGDIDKVVPVAENTSILEEGYKKLGGAIQVIHKATCDHHPHSLPNPEPIIQFILKAHLDTAEQE